MSLAVVASICVPSSLTIYDVAKYAAEWQTQLNEVDSVEVDLQHLAELDAAGLQLLLALAGTLRQREISSHHIMPVDSRLAGWLLPLLQITSEDGQCC